MARRNRRAAPSQLVVRRQRAQKKKIDPDPLGQTAPSESPDGRCERHGRLLYRSHRHALRALQALRTQREQSILFGRPECAERFETRAYECWSSGEVVGWHLTSLEGEPSLRIEQLEEASNAGQIGQKLVDVSQATPQRLFEVLGRAHHQRQLEESEAQAQRQEGAA